MRSETIRVFKYKSLESSEKTKEVIDILRNQRLFCSEAEFFNDASEGAFGAATLPEDGWRLDSSQMASNEVARIQKGLRICSLSKRPDNRMLWNHYANKYGGAVLEIELPNLGKINQEVTERGFEASVGEMILDDVEYGNCSLGDWPKRFPEAAAFKAYGIKSPEWRCEEEVRIISRTRALCEGKYLNLPWPVRRVIFGPRSQPEFATHVIELCGHHGIPCLWAFNFSSSLEFARFRSSEFTEGGKMRKPIAFYFDSVRRWKRDNSAQFIRAKP